MEILEELGFTQVFTNTFIPVSAESTVNIATLSPLTPWYTGNTLLQELISLDKVHKVDPNGPLLMVTTQHKWEPGGYRCYCTVISGVLIIADHLVSTINPMNESQIQVRRIYAQGKNHVDSRLWSELSFCLSSYLYLSGRVGSYLTRKGHDKYNVCKGMIARIFVLGEMMEELFKTYNAVIYCHSMHTGVKIEDIISSEDSLTASTCRQWPSGSALTVRLSLREPSYLSKYTDHPRLGRFIVRIDNYTAYCGWVQEVIN